MKQLTIEYNSGIVEKYDPVTDYDHKNAMYTFRVGHTRFAIPSHLVKSIITEDINYDA